MGECSVGSPVEVHLNGIKTGIVRWIGYVKDPSCVIAGLEMVIIVLLRSFSQCGTTKPNFKQIHNFVTLKCFNSAQDEEMTSSEKGRCGMLNGYQMFTCEPRKGLFISLNKCKPARRFAASHQTGSGITNKQDMLLTLWPCIYKEQSNAHNVRLIMRWDNIKTQIYNL